MISKPVVAPESRLMDSEVTSPSLRTCEELLPPYCFQMRLKQSVLPNVCMCECSYVGVFRFPLLSVCCCWRIGGQHMLLISSLAVVDICTPPSPPLPQPLPASLCIETVLSPLFCGGHSSLVPHRGRSALHTETQNRSSAGSVASSCNHR